MEICEKYINSRTHYYLLGLNTNYTINIINYMILKEIIDFIKFLKK